MCPCSGVSGSVLPCPFPHPSESRSSHPDSRNVLLGADSEQGPGRHNRYLRRAWLLAPVLVSRDRGCIRAIAAETGTAKGSSIATRSRPWASPAPPDPIRCCSPTARPAHAKKLAAHPFGKTTLYQPEQFQESKVVSACRVTTPRCLHKQLMTHVRPPVRIQLEPEIKAVMLEMLVNNFFGSNSLRPDSNSLMCRAGSVNRSHRVRYGHESPWHPDALLAELSQRHSPNQGGVCRLSKQLTNLWGRKEQKALWKQFKPMRPMNRCAATSSFWPRKLRRPSYVSWAIARPWRETRRLRKGVSRDQAC